MKNEDKPGSIAPATIGRLSEIIRDHCEDMASAEDGEIIVDLIELHRSLSEDSEAM